MSSDGAVVSTVGSKGDIWSVYHRAMLCSGLLPQGLPAALVSKSMKLWCESECEHAVFVSCLLMLMQFVSRF